MLQVRDITHRFADVLVLNHVSFTINRGDRAGLIGPNGCGKTTLMRILMGELAASRGSVLFTPASLRVGYLPQTLDVAPGATVGDVLLAASGEHDAAEERLQQLAEQVALAAPGPALDRALAEYERGLAHVEALGGSRQADAETVLAGLGLADVPLDNPVAALSGGQKTRLGLARLLLSQPDLLLLDEPTNHLDIEALTWLEEYLAAYRGAVLVISHDRAFLDNTVTRILAIDGSTHTLREYAGSYTDYAMTLDRELDKQWAAYHEQQERLARLESSIQGLSNQAKGIEQETIAFYWRKQALGLARRAVVQKRRLERMLESEDRIEKPGLTWKMKLEFADTPRSGQDVLQLNELAMGYGPRVLFSEVNLRLTYGERVVLLGPNGTGKTTLMRGITGALAPLAGEIRLGRGVRLGYMAQQDPPANPESTPLQEVRAVAPLDETDARSFLHYFLFAGDEVFRPLGRLSQGELKRLQLALLAAQGCNFLLLDEPLNHLDIDSRESFENAMARFEGTVLAVSHDRYFVERFASTIWQLGDGRIRSLV